MMKYKSTVILIMLVMALVFTSCAAGGSTTEAASDSASDTATTTSATTQSNTRENEMKVTISINGTAFTATLEDNAAAMELYNIIKAEGLTVEMSDYSGFEKVGALGHTLTAQDKQTAAQAGDIVLYQSNQLVLFYGANSWRYTRLGRIDDISGWEEALGSGDITADFSAE